MNDGLILTAVFSIVVILIIIFLLAFKNFFFSGNNDVPLVLESPGPKEKIPCILCGARLVKGENLISEEYRGEKESLVYVRGCPYCTGKLDSRERTCPVCKKKMDEKNYLIARMWEKKNGKRHLHVSGCVSCSGLMKR